mmetsp:Transcript_5782/g.17472  ORF Transcript_5782/g.17472 Transcript_5782/m.17472 type:complete len:276 (-) Transcript_5782:778-1605(-)
MTPTRDPCTLRRETTASTSDSLRTGVSTEATTPPLPRTTPPRFPRLLAWTTPGTTTPRPKPLAWASPSRMPGPRPWTSTWMTGPLTWTTRPPLPEASALPWETPSRRSGERTSGPRMLYRIPMTAPLELPSVMQAFPPKARHRGRRMATAVFPAATPSLALTSTESPRPTLVCTQGSGERTPPPMAFSESTEKPLSGQPPAPLSATAMLLEVRVPAETNWGRLLRWDPSFACCFEQAFCMLHVENKTFYHQSLRLLFAWKGWTSSASLQTRLQPQ